MTLLAATLLLTACAPAPSAESPPDPAGVEQALVLADPGRAEALLDGLVEQLASPDCPVELYVDGDGLRETWAGCGDPDVRGAVDRFDDERSSWMEVEGLALDDKARMDGAIDRVIEGEGLASIDLAGALCGGAWGACPELALADLSWLLAAEDDGATEVLVTGTLLRSELGATTMEGSWRSDPAACELEPVEGTLLLQDSHTHLLTFDGGDRCDGCVVWSVDGEDIDVLCPESPEG